MSWHLNRRFTHFKQKLKEAGAEWQGTDTEFVQFIHKAIPYLPEYIREDMERYYIKGESRAVDPNTGKFTKQSALLYQNVRAGRAAIAFYIRASQYLEG